jgi:hypothetical protein
MSIDYTIRVIEMPHRQVQNLLRRSFQMNLRFVISAAILLSVVAFAQTPVGADDPYQVKYASNLSTGDSVFNISNSGATGASICVNVYAFSPDEQEISCCSCVVTPNALVSLSARNDLISNTLTPAVPNSIVVKLVATTNTAACNASTPTAATLATAGGLLAWGTTIHAAPTTPASFSVTETAFTPATLSAAELTRITGLCGFIQSNGSGFGICRSCRFGGLGADKQ